MTVRTPIATRSSRLPAWAVWLTVFFLLVGGVYFASNVNGTNPALAGGPQPSASAAPGGVDVAAAMALVKKAQCQACHGANWEGAVGPSLIGIAEGPKTPDLQPVAQEHPDNWLHLWIAGTDPAVANINRKSMPKFGEGTLTDAEIDTIVAYLKTLK
ncbi:MAG TPA: cytochrome c [Candidatus Limnocylindria bacterium]|jgi:mono/diheme cytochrome c family protein|nr:cytochrome c [Candidatus Limnocylindria bacterium]